MGILMVSKVLVLLLLCLRCEFWLTTLQCRKKKCFYEEDWVPHRSLHKKKHLLWRLFDTLFPWMTYICAYTGHTNYIYCVILKQLKNWMGMWEKNVGRFRQEFRGEQDWNTLHVYMIFSINVKYHIKIYKNNCTYTLHTIRWKKHAKTKNRFTISLPLIPSASET